MNKQSDLSGHDKIHSCMATKYFIAMIIKPLFFEQFYGIILTYFWTIITAGIGSSTNPETLLLWWQFVLVWVQLISIYLAPQPKNYLWGSVVAFPSGYFDREWVYLHSLNPCLNPLDLVRDGGCSTSLGIFKRSLIAGILRKYTWPKDMKLDVHQ